jgi:hypothetical protein
LPAASSRQRSGCRPASTAALRQHAVRVFSSKDLGRSFSVAGAGDLRPLPSPSFSRRGEEGPPIQPNFVPVWQRFSSDSRSSFPAICAVWSAGVRFYRDLRCLEPKENGGAQKSSFAQLLRWCVQVFPETPLQCGRGAEVWAAGAEPPGRGPLGRWDRPLGPRARATRKSHRDGGNGVFSKTHNYFNIYFLSLLY